MVNKALNLLNNRHSFTKNKSKQLAAANKKNGGREEQGLDKPKENFGPRAIGIKDLFQTTPSFQKR